MLKRSRISVSQVLFPKEIFFCKNLVAVRKIKEALTLNKPLYVGNA